MTNVNQPKPLTPEEKEAWLVEYQTCQAHTNSIGSQYWALVGTFIGFTTAFLAFLNYRDSRWPALALGLAAIIIIYVLWRMLKRIDTLIFSNNFRMREIEERLEFNMLKNRTIRWLDEKEALPPEQTTRINRLRAQLNCLYEKPGRRIVCWLFVTVVLLWVFFIVAAFLPYI